LNTKLNKFLPSERIKTRLIDRIAYSSDAGFYRLIPQAIVQPNTVQEVKNLLAFAKEQKIPLTFRTGGTSLSGQAVTDGILVDLSQHWRKVIAEENGTRVRVQPGVIGSWVNLSLKQYKAKMGPDPSSIASAMMGGILSNNASGMCCGVQHNSYHTLHSIRFVLPSGNEFSTENKADYTLFEEKEPFLYATLLKLRDNICLNNSLLSRIRHKYQTKNTVGYALNAFVDYEHPLDIFAHLLIGSEGTLAFIAEAVLNTVPDLPHKATSLLLFADISEACHAIVPLTTSGAEAVELMDRASLRAIEHLEGLPTDLKNLPATAAALLIEYQAETEAQLQYLLQEAPPLLASFQTLSPIIFTQDVVQQSHLWKIRKGLFPAVGAVRKQGATVILEDVAFPVQHLANAVQDLQLLFAKHGYDNAIIFGHAKDGNLHFVVTQAFDKESETQRYAAFIEEMVTLVVHKYDGTLKAEHGTGRNMAPFVETEWGAEGYAIMQELKKAVDPDGILNPGVIISNDKEIHLKNLKTLPVVESEVDKCIECGFCERLCPSRDVTLTPRKRIVVRRFMEELKNADRVRNPVSVDLEELKKQYQYDGLDTCAVDGLCATDCPVDINTGELVKRLRKENHSPFANKVALVIAQNFGFTEVVAKAMIGMGNRINKVLGNNTLYSFTSVIRKANVPFPLWMNGLKSPSKSTTYTTITSNTKAVVFETCIQRMMGGNKKHITWIDTLVSLSQKSDIQLVINNTKGQCCSQAFSSKGFTDAASLKANEAVEWLWEASEQGAYPIVVDTSSCAYTLQNAAHLLSETNRAHLYQLKIMDVTEFSADYLLKRLIVKHKKKSVALHPVCSLEKMKLKGKMLAVAKACADEVIVPQHAGCCGMAGDRGFFFPELTQAATHLEAEEIKNAPQCEGHYSTGRTCEMALTEATGKEYVSLLYLLDEVS
jgi:D-lactate dehydrogenase